MTTESTELTNFATILARVKPFPRIVQQVRTLANDPKSTVVDVSRALEQDVGLAADVLRLVNAPVSGLAQRCTSLRHAVALLGLARVAGVVSGAAALSFVEGASSLAPKIAAHAVAVAGVARMLASYTGVSPDEAFTAGLLHDVGAMLLLQEGDHLYEELVEQTGGVEADVAEERALLGFDHAAAGGHVLRAWCLPAPIPDAVECHHDWDAAVGRGPTVLALVALLTIADTLVPRLMTNEVPRAEDLELARTEAAFAAVGLTRDELFYMWNGLRLACNKAHLVRGAHDKDVDDACVSAPAAAPAPKRTAWPVIVAVVITVLVAAAAAVHAVV